MINKFVKMIITTLLLNHYYNFAKTSKELKLGILSNILSTIKNQPSFHHFSRTNTIKLDL